MKKMLIILFFLPVMVYAQKRDIFFLVEYSSVFDSISFSGKVEQYKNAFKLKEKKNKIGLEVYKKGKIFKFNISEKHLDRFNVISINEKSVDETRVVVRRGDSFVYMNYEEYNFAHFDLQIDVLSVLADDDKIFTNSLPFNELLSENLKFFF